MKCFLCDECGLMVFFKNDRCLKCDHPLGFLPDILNISTLEGAPNNLWRPERRETGHLYRHCANGQQHQVCNWMVPENDPNPLCVACRLNEVIPNLTDDKNRVRWAKLELAKRRCVYTLLRLGLRLEGWGEKNTSSLRFRFLQDQPGAPVLTGHENGIITVNIAEADDDEREHRRESLHEPYRTLVGHIRHESGHFYWDCLIANSPQISKFSELFGDETADYGAALKKHYQQGPPPDWQNQTVTAYATSHPWEDWAETWAHYLHIMETLETSAYFGLSVHPPSAANADSKAFSPTAFSQMDFDGLISHWGPLVCVLNTINRGMGLSDLYPFAIAPAVVEKLRFIHGVIMTAAGSAK
jgi:hypothetical protein